MLRMRKDGIAPALLAGLVLAACARNDRAIPVREETCPSGRQDCAGECVLVNTNPQHCGSCWQACSGSEACDLGRCVPRQVCDGPGIDDCGRGCVDLASDESHCGRCGNLCPLTETCMDGSCVPLACDDTGHRRCGVSCVDVTADEANCGDCGTSCESTELCLDGSCEPTCDDDQIECPVNEGGTVCIDARTDASNCGDCGVTCGEGMECVDSSCECASGSMCDGVCVDTSSDVANCRGCGVECTTGQACGASGCYCPTTTACGGGSACSPACAPDNDRRVNATRFTLGDTEVTLHGTTSGATPDGAGATCRCSGGSRPDVWFRFVLTDREVVYFDTAGSSFDTAIYLTNSGGTPLPGASGTEFTSLGMCNDDARCGTTGDFTSNLQSRTAGQLAAGTYYVVVTGCGVGDFTLRGQRLPSLGFQYRSQLRGTGTTTATNVNGVPESAGTCGGSSGPEDQRWFITCGERTQFFSNCPSDAGSWTRSVAGQRFDSVLYMRSALTGAQVACNDDGRSAGATDCRGTGGDDLHFGSRLNDIVAPRGLNAVFIDTRTTDPGMGYTLRYTIR